MRKIDRTRRGWTSGIFMMLLFGAALTATCDGGDGGSTAGVPFANFGAACADDSTCQSGVCVPLGNGQNACSKPCSEDANACLSGWTCISGFGACTCVYAPESCNGKDDDCNGVVDDLPSDAPECIPPNEGCFNDSGFDATSPVVSFKTDVLPMFRASCGLSFACHGMEAAQPGQPFLGPSLVDPDPTPAQIAAIFAQIVGVPALKAAAMKRVDPGNPKTSFLMHKLDGTLTCVDLVCDVGCGSSMPLGNNILPIDKRDTVRRWIAQGAKND